VAHDFPTMSVALAAERDLQPRARISRWPLVVGLFGLAVAGAAMAVSLWAGRSWPQIAADQLNGLAYVLAGTIAWHRRPTNPFGAVMLAAGLTWYVPTFVALPVPTVTAVAYAIGWVTNVFVGYLLLTYPTGRLPSPGAKAVFAVLVVSTIIQTGVRLFLLDSGTDFNDLTGTSVLVYGCDCANPFALLPDDRLFGIGMLVTRIVASVGALVILGLIARRWLSASPAGRRQLVPVVFAGAVGLVTFAVEETFVAGGAGYNAPAVLIDYGVNIARAAVPIGFLLGLLRMQIDRALVGRLVVELGASPSPEQLEMVVARTLHDSSARVVYWSPTGGTYVDGYGRPANLGVEPGRAVNNVDRSGEPLCALEYDAALTDEPDLLTAVSAALSLSIDRDRLASTVRAQAEDANSLPRGLVTFLYSDIEASSELLERLGAAYAEALEESRRLQRTITRRHGGREVDSRADEFFAVFPDGASPATAAVEIQRAFRDRRWPNSETVRVRVALHTGQADVRDGGYVGVDVHLVARVGSAGHGGQMLVSETAAAAAGDKLPNGIRLVELGDFGLRGISGRHLIFQLVVPDLPAEFPQLRYLELGAR